MRTNEPLRCYVNDLQNAPNIINPQHDAVPALGLASSGAHATVAFSAPQQQLGSAVSPWWTERASASVLALRSPAVACLLPPSSTAQLQITVRVESGVGIVARTSGPRCPSFPRGNFSCAFSGCPILSRLVWLGRPMTR